VRGRAFHIFLVFVDHLARQLPQFVVFVVVPDLQVIFGNPTQIGILVSETDGYGIVELAAMRGELCFKSLRIPPEADLQIFADVAGIEDDPGGGDGELGNQTEFDFV